MQCEKCGKKYSRETHYKRHLKKCKGLSKKRNLARKSKKSSYRCTVKGCNCRYVRLYQLRLHMQNVHKIPQGI